MNYTYSYSVSKADLWCLAASEVFKQQEQPKTLDGWVDWIAHHLATCGARIKKMPSRQEIQQCTIDSFHRLMQEGKLLELKGVYVVTDLWRLAAEWVDVREQYTDTASSLKLVPSTDPEFVFTAVVQNGDRLQPACHFRTPQQALDFLYANVRECS